MEKSETEAQDVREGDETRTSAQHMSAHDALVAWDDARRAREVNERTIVEVMFNNVDQKLELGKGACHDLLKYVKELARSQHEFVKSFGKLGNALDERLHYGSLENAVVVLKMHSINSCSIYEEHNKILTDTIAAQLTQLVTEYSKQSSKVMDSAKKSGKDYDQAREIANKNFSSYLNAFHEHLAAEKQGTIPSHDPWMAERVYHSSLEALKLERDKFSLELELIFENFLQLEEKRIEATKDVLQVHVTKQKLIFGKLSEGINGLDIASQGIDTTADRQLLMKQSFNRRNIAQSHLLQLTQQIQQQKLAQAQAKHGVTPQMAQQVADLQQQHAELRADLASGGGSLSQSQSLSQLHTSQVEGAPPLPPRDQVSQQYAPHEKHKSLSALDRQKAQNFGFRSSMEITKPAPHVMEPPKTGYLFKKSKIMKSWKQTHCVLTSSGFLYIFTSKEKFSPKYTVPLANVSVQPLTDTEEPNVFELIANQGSFFNTTKYLLQAESKEALNEWTSMIQRYSGSKK